jgi:hypothetical protein
MKASTASFTGQQRRKEILHALTCAGFLASCGAWPQAAFAESGTFEAVFSTVNSVHQIDRGDGNSIVGGASIGTFAVFKGSGSPFAEGSVGQAECVPLVKKGPNSIDLESHCTFTSTADDKLFGLFKRTSGDMAAGTGGQGRLELLGGTGRYKGITGACSYKTSYLPQNGVVTFARCEWRS